MNKPPPDLTTVYSFARADGGRNIAPKNMWGTLEAIATLPECVAILDSARSVPSAALQHGFFFGTSDAVYLHLDGPGSSNPELGEHRREFPRQAPDDSQT